MKKLVTKSNICDFLVEGENKFYVNSSMIISPGVKDILRNKGIVIEYGLKENCSKEITMCNKTSREDKCDSNSKLSKNITELLTKEYKVTDDGFIKEVTIKVVNKIEELRRK